MLEEIGQPYETVLLDYRKDLKEDWYRAINPMAKIPSVRHGESIITECPAICAYLAEAFPESQLAPEVGMRSSYYRWLFFTAGPLEQSTVNQAIGVQVSSEQEGMVGYGNLNRVVATLSQLLQEHEYVAGERFSAADLYLASNIQWNMDMKVLEKRQEFVDYCERMHSRPACIKSQQIDDNALAELQSGS